MLVHKIIYIIRNKNWIKNFHILQAIQVTVKLAIQAVQLMSISSQKIIITVSGQNNKLIFVIILRLLLLGFTFGSLKDGGEQAIKV